VATLSFRDRFFTPRVAHAVTSPSGILAFGAGAAATVVASGVVALTAPVTVPLAIAGGALAYGIRVALAIPKQATGERIDAFSVAEPWRHAVRDAQAARRRFDDAVRTFREGPLQDALSEISGRLDEAVEECWQIAKQGQIVTDARKRIDHREVQWELERVGGQLGPGGRGTPTQARTIASLQAQLATAQRMDDLIATTRDELDLLNARLDESVTQAIELSVSNRAGSLDPLGADVDDIVDDLASLRLAFQDVNHGDPSDVEGGIVSDEPSTPPGDALALPPPPPPPPPPTQGSTGWSRRSPGL